MSKALALRNATLRLAANAGVNLDLATQVDLVPRLRPLLSAAVAEAQTIALLGASTPGLIAELIHLGRGKRLTIVERDRTLIPEGLLDPIGPHKATIKIICEPTDLRTDPRAFDELVAEMKPTDYTAFKAVANRIMSEARDSPLIADCSVDLVIVDCMVNRLSRANSGLVLDEAYRVLRRNGRLLGICFLADEVPREAEVAANVGPWPAVRFPLELDGASELALAGFHGVTYHSLFPRPLHTFSGAEVRLFLLEAFKGKQGACWDQGHAVVYRGPWSSVCDDDGHRYIRGERTAVCAKTYDILTRAPYRHEFLGLPAYVEVPLDQAPAFDCNVPGVRSPAATKGRVSIPGVSRDAATKSDCCSTPQSAGNPCCS